MTSNAWDPAFDQFMETADAVARERSDVDLDMAREVFGEVATLLYNGLALDGLDEHDTAAVISGLCADLIGKDPGGAIRERSKKVLVEPGDLHYPEGVSRAYLISAGILQL